MSRTLRHILLMFVLIAGVVGLTACEGFEPGVDRTPPVFSGIEDITYVIGDPVPDLLEGVTANDRVDGDVTAAIEIDDSEVDFTTPGVYTVTFTVSDEAGNVRNASMTVTVVEPDEPDEPDTGQEENAALDIAALSWEPGESLPLSGENGTTFTWVSGNPYVIVIDIINRVHVVNPAIGDDPIDVTMTVTARNGSYSTTFEYIVTVEPREESVVTDKISLPFTSTSDEWFVDDNPAVDIYFVDEGTVPYVDVETFLMLLDGAIESDLLVFDYDDDILTITYTAVYTDIYDEEVEEDLWAVIDFTANTMTVSSFRFFSYYIVSTETDFGEGLVYLDVETVEPQSVTFDLNHYRIDLVIDEDDDVYLMPFHVANLLFAGRIYYDIYYNGDALIGFDTFSRGDSAIQAQLRASSLNGAALARDIREATYHFMAFALDHFFGLKDFREVDTYYHFLVSYLPTIMFGTNTTVNNNMFGIVNAIDDLHSSHAFPGYYARTEYSIQVTTLDQLGPSVQNWYQGLWEVQDLLAAKFGSHQNLPEYRLIDANKTAIIYLTGFTVDTPGDFKRTLDLLPASVENVVIDLTYNTGGNLGAVLRLFGYMTDEPITYHSQNPADGSAVTYYIGSEYTPYDYEWFIATSSVTFSAANLMASIAKETGVATVFGRHSSGGASSIGLVILPVGTTWIISTNNVLSTRIGDPETGYTYLSIEEGVEVDIFVFDFTDDDAIIAAINQAKGENDE